MVMARVTRKSFLNGVRLYPGELVEVDLKELGIKNLGETKNLEAVGDGGEAIEQVPVAPVTAHAPGANAPQGIPAGSRISGTGRTLAPADPGQSAEAIEPVAGGVDSAFDHDGDGKPGGSRKK